MKFYESKIDIVYIDGNFLVWDKCPIDNCENHVCLRINSNYCYVHTVCECGAEKCCSNKHSDWCPKYIEGGEEE